MERNEFSIRQEHLVTRQTEHDKQFKKQLKYISQISLAMQFNKQLKNISQISISNEYNPEANLLDQ